jgi:hypothetical protein
MSKPLTSRERRVYRLITCVTSAVWAAALLRYFVLTDRAHEASLLEVCLLAANTMLMFGFGYALRSNLRVIRGVRWL